MEVKDLKAKKQSSLLDDMKPECLYFASESVGEGHPDKLCDQISDAILDACLKVDKDAKVAIEAAAKANMVSLVKLTLQIVLLGEISMPNSNG